VGTSLGLLVISLSDMEMLVQYESVVEEMNAMDDHRAG